MVFRRIRQRRALKRALYDEASRLEGELGEIRRVMCAEARQAGVDLDRLSCSTPSCPTCGAPLVIRTAKVQRYNGSQFWGCSRWPSCQQGVIDLSAYPAAAWQAVRH